MMEGGVHKEDRLPPGFRFHPTDEELITYYLRHKIMDSNFSARAIGEADLNKCEPWDLPGKAKMGEKEWYFFSLRDRKYPTGVRTNRATSAGYWKTTGKDREIFNGNNTELVGMKKTLVFYKGRAPRGEKSNWVMHEYRLHSKSAFKGNKDEWVVCRVFMKSSGGAAGKKYPSNQARSNPYHIDNTLGGASTIPSLLPDDPSHFTAAGSHLLASTTAELMELSKLSRSNRGGLSLPSLPHLNYAGAFTLSGLNLNFAASPAPGLRPSVLGGMQIPPPHQPQVMTADHQQPHPVLPNCIMGMDGGFSANINSTASGSRYRQNMDSLDLEGYWPSY